MGNGITTETKQGQLHPIAGKLSGQMTEQIIKIKKEQISGTLNKGISI